MIAVRYSYAEAALFGEVPGGAEVLHKPFRAEQLAARVAGLVASTDVPAA